MVHSSTCSNKVPTYHLQVTKEARKFKPYDDDKRANWHNPYDEFLGQGPPSKGLGTAGDIYIDSTEKARALYAKDIDNAWLRWNGPSNVDKLIPHPLFPATRFLWVRGLSAGWMKRSQIKPQRKFLIPTGLTFSTISRRNRRSITWPYNSISNIETTQEVCVCCNSRLKSREKTKNFSRNHPSESHLTNPCIAFTAHSGSATLSHSGTFNIFVRAD